MPSQSPWIFQPIGAPFSEMPMKIIGQDDMYVTVWYKHGKPVHGRAWNNDGVFECTFPRSKIDLLGVGSAAGGGNGGGGFRAKNNRGSISPGPASGPSLPPTPHGGCGCGDSTMKLSQKILIPHHNSYNFIGRILGPRGNSVRRLEALTDCKILIRGKGSIKDANREMRMRNMPGWEHLNEELHVLVVAEDVNEHLCQLKLRRAVTSIQRLLTPQFDEYKRQQLIQLAIINGTYRP